MLTDIKSFVLGVLSSMTAVFLLFLLRNTIKAGVSFVVKFFAGSLIQDISGIWYTKVTEKKGNRIQAEYKEIVNLKQLGRHVWGTIKLKNNGSEIEYEFEGTFQHKILYASFSSKNNQDYEVGTFTLLYKRKGSTCFFEGHSSYCSRETGDTIESGTYCWSRKEWN